MVAYSALVNDEVREKCKDAGFNVVIETPLTVTKIQRHILSVLE